MTNNPPKRRLTTHFQAVLYAIEQMDANLLDDFLDEQHTYECLTKARFIQIMDEVFQKFQRAGDRYLLSSPGYCNEKTCNHMKGGFRFTGNQSGKKMDLVMEEKDSRVIDIYYCSVFCASDAPFYSEDIDIDSFFNTYDHNIRIADMLLEERKNKKGGQRLDEYNEDDLPF